MATRSNGTGNASSTRSVAADGSGTGALQGSASRQDGVNVSANGSANGSMQAGRQSQPAN